MVSREVESWHQLERETKEESIFKSGKRKLGPFLDLSETSFYKDGSMGKEYTCALKVCEDTKSTILKPENCVTLVSRCVR